MLPVVWLFGASGVGKSTTGYRMLSALRSAGLTGAFVDADQLRHAAGVTISENALIAAALPGLSRRFRAHGAHVLIVAGLLDDAGHLDRLLPGLPRDHVLTVHLDADGDTIRERVRRRGWLVELADEAAAAAGHINPDLADMRVDTIDRSPADLAAHLAPVAISHARCTRSPGGAPEPSHGFSGVPRRVVTITGPGGVGSSTAGFATFLHLAREGAAVGYVDSHQLGFLGTDASDDQLDLLRADNTREVAGSLARGGAQTIVVSGEARTIRLLSGGWGEATTQEFWLHASHHALADRIRARAQGGGPPLQGDHRLGLRGPALEAAISVAVAQSEGADLWPTRAQVLDTTGLGAAQVAEVIARSLTGG